MKKVLVLTAALAATMMITACPGPNEPTPSESPMPTESTSPEPTESTSPEPTESTSPETPDPSESNEPTEPEASADPAASFELTAASATQLPKFRYGFTIEGTALGTIGDYTSLQVTASGATVKIIENGVAKNNVEITDVVVTPSTITFTWLPPNGAPTDQDLIKIDSQRLGEAAESTSVRLTVADGL